MFEGFVDRKRELRVLHELLARPASFALVYGQRRVGKTWLLRKLLAESPRGLYYCADESTSDALLSRFSVAARRAGLTGRLWDAVKPRDWSSALTLLLDEAQRSEQPLVLVLDEFQYLASAVPELPSVLQRLWDEAHLAGGLHVVLCGSALGTMAALSDVGQPLHGRFDLRMKLGPFGHVEAAEFLPGWAAVDQLRAYGVFGGLARHLAALRSDEDLKRNALRVILEPLGVLHEAPLDLLRTEHLSSLAESSAVLEAVARGENRFGAIAARTNLKAPRLDAVLKELVGLEILNKELRLGDKPGSRFARYRPTDPFTRFWFRHVHPHRSALLSAVPEGVWDERVAPRLNEHMGLIFEDVVKASLRAGLLGPADEVRPWWSRDGQTELDAVVRQGETLIYVECKWRPAGQVGPRDLERLQEHKRRSRLKGRRERYCLATVGQFTPALRAMAAELEGLVLVGLADLFGG